jgi:allophanate hydrolase
VPSAAWSRPIPAPLGLGTIDLEDGSSCQGFLVESAGLSGASDITSHGGWRSYLARKAAL